LGTILLQEWNDETFNLELLVAIIPLTLGCCSLIAPGVYSVDCEAEYLKIVVHSVSFTWQVKIYVQMAYAFPELVSSE
jgi:hypothetical protein